MTRHLLNGLVLIGLIAGLLLFWPRGEMPVLSVHAQGASVSTNTAYTNNPPAWKAMEDYFAALAKNQVPRASEIVPQIMAHSTNDWNALNFLSWRIFADRNIKYRDRPLALAAAQRALQLTGEKEPAVLDTYARALFENGHHDEAIRCQKRAVALCTVEAKRIDMEANLNRYVRLAGQSQKAR
jgi:tetratricopeptide (TPR) repeat protein